MSDRDRPQFLPPEEPAPPEPPAPDVPEGPDRLTWIVVAVSAVLLLLVGGLALLRSGGDGPSPAKAGTSPSDYAAVPDPCAAPLPADVRTVTPRPGRDSCTWELLRPEKSRSFEVAFRLSSSAQGASGTVRAAKEFADDLAYTSDPVRNGGFEHDPERLSGLGDEAFAAQSSNLVVSGRTSYDMGGAEVEVRRRNVVLTVKWRGADYPARVRGDQKLVGTRLPYPDAKRQAVSTAVTLLGRLH
ncbi:hypothetical protein [Actinomadura sp. DC4]|uniref:hypothetical protein n=1 Tax=Actinomadura sp. DC4 TaxID=3055069 RepID=UPI0025B1FDF4|nr:hypothetical protein [Actinomadura sp. DC4]MDN3359723.1 hypothetical protein [Actinomadura sp. DC4]